MRKSPFEVSLATMEQLDECVQLALQIPLENEWDSFPAPDYDKVQETLKKLIEDQTLIIYTNNKIIVGILGCIIDTFWWSNQPMMMDALFYIKPEFRSYAAFDRLLSTAEEFAKINGLPLALLFFTTKDTERKFNMVQKRGYKPIGFWVLRKRE